MLSSLKITLALIKRSQPDFEFRAWPDWEPCEQVDFALVWQPPPGLLAKCNNLKGVISLGATVDHLLPVIEDLPDGIWDWLSQYPESFIIRPGETLPWDRGAVANQNLVVAPIVNR